VPVFQRMTFDFYAMFRYMLRACAGFLSPLSVEFSPKSLGGCADGDTSVQTILCFYLH